MQQHFELKQKAKPVLKKKKIKPKKDNIKTRQQSPDVDIEKDLDITNIEVPAA